MAGRRKPHSGDKPEASEEEPEPSRGASATVASPPPASPPAHSAGGYIARTPIVHGVGDTRRRFEVGERIEDVDAAGIERLLDRDLIKPE